MNGCSQVNKMSKNRNNDHSEQLHTWLLIHHVLSYTLGDRKMGRCFRKPFKKNQNACSLN